MYPRMPDFIKQVSAATVSAYSLFNWLCTTRNIHNAIEVGVYHGATTWMLLQCLEKPCHLVSVDRSQEYLDYAEINSIPAAFDGKWIPVHADSGKIDYTKYIKDVDLGWIDGKHTYKQVLADYRAMKPVLSQDAVLVFHDHRGGKYQGVRNAVTEIAKDGWVTWSLSSKIERNEYAVARRI